MFLILVKPGGVEKLRPTEISAPFLTPILLSLKLPGHLFVHHIFKVLEILAHIVAVVPFHLRRAIQVRPHCLVRQELVLVIILFEPSEKMNWTQVQLLSDG